MTLDLQFKLKSNPIYIQYLHENSYWYKILTRNPTSINNFIEEVKTKYQMRPADRINKALETFEMLSNVLSAFR